MANDLCGKFSDLFLDFNVFKDNCFLDIALLLALVVLSLHAYGLLANLQLDLFSSLYDFNAFLSLNMSLTSCLFFAFMKVKDLAIAFLTTYNHVNNFEITNLYIP